MESEGFKFLIYKWDFDRKGFLIFCKCFLSFLKRVRQKFKIASDLDHQKDLVKIQKSDREIFKNRRFLF